MPRGCFLELFRCYDCSRPTSLAQIVSYIILWCALYTLKVSKLTNIFHYFHHIYHIRIPPPGISFFVGVYGATNPILFRKHVVGGMIVELQYSSWHSNMTPTVTFGRPQTWWNNTHSFFIFTHGFYVTDSRSDTLLHNICISKEFIMLN